MLVWQTALRQTEADVSRAGVTTAVCCRICEAVEHEELRIKLATEAPVLRASKPGLPLHVPIQDLIRGGFCCFHESCSGENTQEHEKDSEKRA